MPDSSLYEPLCELFNISINELFAGQRIKDEEYKTIADQNLMNMMKYKLYQMSDSSITFDEFSHALDQIAHITTILKSFDDKEKAIHFMMEETDLSYEECSSAYDYWIQLFEVK